MKYRHLVAYLGQQRSRELSQRFGDWVKNPYDAKTLQWLPPCPPNPAGKEGPEWVFTEKGFAGIHFEETGITLNNTEPGRFILTPSFIGEAQIYYNPKLKFAFFYYNNSGLDEATVHKILSKLSDIIPRTKKRYNDEVISVENFLLEKT